MANRQRRALNAAMFNATALAAAGLVLPSAPALAQGAVFDEGIDYAVLPPAAGAAGARGGAKAKSGKNSPVEVVEFFWFACPFCWRLEPRLKEWKAQLDPAQVTFKQVHVGFADDGQQRLFATLQVLNRPDLASKVFDAIHIQKKAIRSESDALRFLETESGLPKEAVNTAWRSAAAADIVQASNAQVAALAVKSVPSFVVDGRFLATPQLASGNNARLIQIVNYLVARSRAA